MSWELDADYRYLVDQVLDDGWHRPGRNGGTTMLPGMTLKHDMRSGFPIITTRRVYWRGVFGELAAFLEGTRSLKRFKELGCNYWDMNAKQWAGFDGDDLGPIYGAQWRDFDGVDQLDQLISGLRFDQSSRRHVMTTWHPAKLGQMCLPPCHLLTQFHATTGFLHQTVFMRSVDLCLGLPSDLVLYGLLQHLVAKEVGLKPAKLTFMLGDAHVYDNHDALWQKQRVRGMLPLMPPTLELRDASRLFEFHPDDARIINYAPQEAIQYALN